MEEKTFKIPPEDLRVWNKIWQALQIVCDTLRADVKVCIYWSGTLRCYVMEGLDSKCDPKSYSLGQDVVDGLVQFCTLGKMDRRDLDQGLVVILTS